MNKVLIAILVLGAAGLAYYFIAGDRGDVPFETDTIEEVDVDLAREALKETGPRTVYGSCNAIEDSSNCIDYVGSMWKDKDMAELNCSDIGILSKDACPYSELGGCQMGGGSVMEMIAWVYQEGPGGYNEESVVYASMACNNAPDGRWVNPQDLIE